MQRQYADFYVQNRHNFPLTWRPGTASQLPRFGSAWWPLFHVIPHLLSKMFIAQLYVTARGLTDVEAGWNSCFKGSVCFTTSACQTSKQLYFDIPKPAIRQSCPLHAVIGQVCVGEKVGRVWTSPLSSLFSFLTQILLSPFMCTNIVRISSRRDYLKVCAAITIYKWSSCLTPLYDSWLVTLPSRVVVWSSNECFCLKTRRTN